MNLLIGNVWKSLIISFWVLVVAVIIAPAGEPQDIIWYANVSLSIMLVVSCIFLVVFSLVVIGIKRNQLGVVEVVLAAFLVVLCNVPGSMALYVYFKKQKYIGRH
ncbi:hypothetical protein [Marinimicrobium alkaliphilum]|uniref:hypothetical protein n=1 Tax=Marinimicrobium alkaliphilum TaxID=2202654 RepID=UPI000DB96F10|nr:hypothetical protein [Marinimicrobium alkaliphilum]